MAKLLIIDDDPKICSFLDQLIESMGHDASAANTLEEGLNLAKSGNYDLILLDLEFPDGNGLQILPDLLRVSSSPEVIIITGTGDAGGAELAFKYGAWDYVKKPFVLDEVMLPTTRALQYRQEKANKQTPVTLKRIGIVGESVPIRNCLEEVARASLTDASVLISGETGTGKELFARAVHENSKRFSGNYVTLDCGALPETLAESTLFGHEKGAFTGAEKKQEGVIAQAKYGTLFIDEIGELPLNIQKSLLRSLQEKRIRPLGANKETSVDFRLVAATNRDLAQMVKEKEFREDLFYRIRAIEIRLPPLKERESDIVEITIDKVCQLGQQYGLGTKGVSGEFLEILSAHDWPGNVRELINVIEYSMASAGEDPTLVPKHLPPEYRTAQLNLGSDQMTKATDRFVDISDIKGELPTLSDYRSETERAYLQMLMQRAKGRREEACRLSGISQSRLYGLLKKHNLSRFSS